MLKTNGVIQRNLITLIIFFSITLYGQNINSVDYQNFKTIKLHQGNKDAFEQLKKCTPCILKTYNKKGRLIREAVQQTDCIIGWFKKYDNKGNLIQTGQYLSTINDKSSSTCSIEHGDWFYINWRGDTTFVEVWDKGKFIRQEPEQNKVEIYGINYFLNEKKYVGKEITLTDFQKLEVVPLYKNKKRSKNLILDYEISKVGYKIIEGNVQNFSLSNQNFEKILHKYGMSEEEEIWIKLIFILDDKKIRTEYFKLIK